MITIHQTADPQSELDVRLRDFAGGSKTSDAFALDYRFAQTFLPGAPGQRLLALVLLEKAADRVRMSVSFAEPEDALIRGLNCLRAEPAAVREWCDANERIWLELDRPLRLEAVRIPKPWGQEVWFTGIEERGQSRVADEHGRTVPLPWLLSLCSRRLLGREAGELILLKILDPLPEPVFGDLYFEMHEEKREVYVVTHVDEAAWPDGVGGIRFGFNQDKRADFSGDQSFRESYLAAVQSYRAVREQIDQQLDRQREEKGIALDAPVDTATLRQWLVKVPAELRDEEARLREVMESYIHVDPLRVGDVVKVPCFTPHSLLHGVRTVEFQTPVYERKILSFAQKVLTQKHWDTESALEQVSLEPPERAELPVIAADRNYRLEEVAVFEDFRVERLSLKAGGQYSLNKRGRYSLVMGVAGRLELNGFSLEPEQAAIAGAGDNELILSNVSDDDEVIALLAAPVG